MKTKFKIIAICFLLSFTYRTLYSQFNINAHVATFSIGSLSYSDYYYRNITIITGLLLKGRTQDQKYDTNADYILVRFSQEEVAVIKLRDNLFDFGQRLNFDSMDESIFRIILMSKNKTLEGYDQDKTKWRICFGTEYDKYSCDSKQDALFYLYNGREKLSVLISDFNKILELYKNNSTLSNCEFYKSQLVTIETSAKDLKDRFGYGAFTGNDPYWDTYLEFLGSCTEVEKRSGELSRVLCKPNP